MLERTESTTSTELPPASADLTDGADGIEAPLLITRDMLAPGPRIADSRADFERGMSYAPPLTLAIIAVNVAVFVWEGASGALENQASIVRAGALVRDHVFAGEVWRLFTAMFLHGGIDHLLGNCFALYVVGMALEHAIGSGKALTVYLVAGLAGSIASMTASAGPSVGASGAIFGVLSAVVVFLYANRDRFLMRDKRIGAVLAFWASYTILTGFMTPYVDNWAHLGGLAGGAFAVWGE